jgi:enoyl-CoA hydratase/carnithine racemase
MADEVLVRVREGIATVTLNRPDKRNAMNAALLAALRVAFDGLDPRRDIRAVILAATGSAFCAGMDLRDMEARGGEADPEADVVEVLERVERSPHPTIAMIQGDALAGGLQLALHCDLRVAAEGARLGMPLARVGLVPPYPLTRKLVEIAGPAHARWLLLTARPVDARRALEIGLVHEIVPPERLDGACIALARHIAGNAPLSLAGMKAAIQRALSAGAGVPHEDLDALVREARRSADASEGRRAMLERRPPVFRGE